MTITRPTVALATLTCRCSLPTNHTTPQDLHHYIQLHVARQEGRCGCVPRLSA